MQNTLYCFADKISVINPIFFNKSVVFFHKRVYVFIEGIKGVFMKQAKKIDMTKGPVMKSVILFAIPITAGNLLQQLYNAVDMLIVGNFCGSASLAAVGTSGMPIEFLMCVFLGLGTGVSILVSQYTGGANFAMLKKLVATAISFLYMCAIPLSIIGYLLTPPFLRMMQVPEEAFDLAVSYTRIVFLGTLGNLGYNMNAGVLRGLGDSRATLWFLLISCVTNIVLDLLFVAVFHMDVTGAALATTIAFFVSWGCSILYIKKKHPDLEFKVLPHTFDKQILISIFKIGLPLGLNHSLYSVGHILMQSLINAQGYTFMAAVSISSKICNVANSSINAFASSGTTFAGQNHGAGDYGRIKKGSLRIPLFAGLITLTAGLIVTLFCYPILGLFTPDAEVVDIAARYHTRMVLPFTWWYAIFTCIINYINGIGIVKYPTIVNLLMLWAIRIPVAYLIAHFISGLYIMAAIPISFLFALICMLCFYRTKQWKEIIKRAETD